jgi:hypothetical protein
MSYHDTERMPDPTRTEKCLNCKNSTHSHYGWACQWTFGTSGCMSDYTIDKRFLASDMLIAPTGQPDTLRSIAVAKPHAAVAKEVARDSVPEWKVLRDKGKDNHECVCRIPKDKCEYHREAPKAPVKRYSPWGIF